jgi:hypothetical protein
MKILLTAVGWAIAMGLGTFFFILSSMAFQISPSDRMLQLTFYGLTTGILGGLSIALVLLWSQPTIKWRIALLFVIIWSIALFVGGRIGWHIIQPDFTSGAMTRGVIIGMTIGAMLGGFFTALLLQQTRLLVPWVDVFIVALGWTVAIFSGFALIFFSTEIIPMGIIFVPIIGGLLTGAIGSSIMFWKMHS